MNVAKATYPLITLSLISFLIFTLTQVITLADAQQESVSLVLSESSLALMFTLSNSLPSVLYSVFWLQVPTSQSQDWLEPNHCSTLQIPIAIIPMHIAVVLNSPLHNALKSIIE